MAKNTVTGSVWIPLLRAVITALLVALVIVTAYGMYNLVTAWRLFWFVTSAVALTAWVIIISNTEKHSISPNRIFPKYTRLKIISSDPQNTFQQWRFLDVPISSEKMSRVANQFVRTNSFSMATMAGSGKPLSRTEYEIVRDNFIIHGLAYWVNEHSHNQGVDLTHAGKAVMRRMESTSKSRTHTNAQTGLEV